MTVDGINNNIYITQQNTVSVKQTEQQDTGIFCAEQNNIAGDTINIPLIAHRGYSEAAPENTLPAFYAAVEHGFKTAECDIEWTKDNVPVLLHDKTINRTARRVDGFPMILPRNCSDYTYQQLKDNFDFGSWKGSEFKGTKIPSFDELLQCSKETGLNLYVEIKNTDNFDEEKARILTDAVKKAGLEDSVTWISFDAGYLKTIAEQMPESRLGYLYSGKVTPETIKLLESLRTGNNEVFIDIKSSRMNENADKLLDDAGIPFEAWTVDFADEIEYLSSFDCSGITTNSVTEKELQEYFYGNIE